VFETVFGFSHGVVPARDYGAHCEGYLDEQGHEMQVTSALVMGLEIAGDDDPVILITGPGGVYCGKGMLVGRFEPGTYQVFAGFQQEGGFGKYAVRAEGDTFLKGKGLLVEDNISLSAGFGKHVVVGSQAMSDYQVELVTLDPDAFKHCKGVVNPVQNYTITVDQELLVTFKAETLNAIPVLAIKNLTQGGGLCEGGSKVSPPSASVNRFAAEIQMRLHPGIEYGVWVGNAGPDHSTVHMLYISERADRGAFVSLSGIMVAGSVLLGVGWGVRRFWLRRKKMPDA